MDAKENPVAPARERMPLVAAFIDDIRSAFGSEVIEQAWRRRHQGAFWATENGHELGTRNTEWQTRPVVTGVTLQSEIDALIARSKA